MTVKGLRKQETGFVGFFDILGYKSFLESGISEVTFKVIEILDRLPTLIPEEHKTFVGKTSVIEWALERVVPLVVSDSILLRCSYDENRDASQRVEQAAAFLVAASILERVMFESGLPLRGAISFGDFIFKGHVFAGKPIIDAYTLAHSLNLAACALHETAASEMRTLLMSASEWKGFLDDGLVLPRYPTPVKNVKARFELQCLNFAWPTLKGYTPLKDRKDLREYVHEKFSAHNKQMEQDAFSKASNTETFLRFLRGRFPQLFDRDP